MKPYVVSADLSTLWRRLAGKELPEDALGRFRSQGQAMLERIFRACDWIPEQELTEGLASLLAIEDLPVVTLDLVYSPSGLKLSLTRLVDKDGQDAGYGSREGKGLDLPAAIRELAKRVPGKELVLVDDVLFSGTMYAGIIRGFREFGLRVPRAYAGVAIAEGIRRLRSLDCTVRAVRTYDDVIDEICERDFMPGSPLSGRTVKGCPDFGMPYLLPFGDPVGWASIPQAQARDLSAGFLRLSAGIYRSLHLTVRELPRRIYGLHQLDADAIADEALAYVADSL